MSYDPKTRTITVEEGDSEIQFLADSGKYFVSTIREMALSEGTEEIKPIWNVLEDWLECSGRTLNETDLDKIERAWKAYISIGLAPSHRLQEAFDSFSNIRRAEGYDFKHDKPPTKVMDAFDKMLATDNEIAEKSKADVEKEAEEFSKIFRKFRSNARKTGISVEARKVPVAVIAVWLLVSLPLSGLIFDEFFGGNDLLNRVFSWIVVGAASLLPAGWKWITNGKPFGRWFVLLVTLVYLAAGGIFFADRYLDEIAYIPILSLFAFFMTIFSYDGKATLGLGR